MKRRVKPLSAERKKKALQHDSALPQRKAPLKRTVQLRTGGPLPRESAKRRQLSVERRSFVAEFLAKNPRCMVRWNGGCTGWAVHVHEALTRGRGGVIVPTPGREQLFVATCWWCHAMVHDHPEEAARRGWLMTHGRGSRPSVVILDDPPPDVAQPSTEARLAAVAARFGLGR